MGVRVVLLVASVAIAASTNTTTFSASRYPAGIEECSWLNWIADILHIDDMDSVKEHVVGSVQSLNTSLESIGNGIITPSVVTEIGQHISKIACTRDHNLIGNCVGLSNIACMFKKYTADDDQVIFNKTDGAVASPPNHKVVFENDRVRVINAYCAPESPELAFHTHTRLSFWISWGTSRGERYYGYNGTALYNDSVWDRKEGSVLRVMFNGPEWFHMLEDKEPDNVAPGNCQTDKAPSCANGFKYRVELKLNGKAANPVLSQVRRTSAKEAASWLHWMSHQVAMRQIR